MALEDLLGSSKYISDLVKTNPVGSTDFKSTLDDHITGFKNVVLNTFPNITGAVTASHTELNLLDGLSDMNYLRDDADDTMAGSLTLERVILSQVAQELSVSVATSGSITLNLSSGSYFYTGTLTGIPTFAFSNVPVTGQVVTVTLELDGASSYVPVFTPTVIWQNGQTPVWSTGKDIITLRTRDGGTTWQGYTAGRAMA